MAEPTLDPQATLDAKARTLAAFENFLRQPENWRYFSTTKPVPKGERLKQLAQTIYEKLDSNYHGKAPFSEWALAGGDGEPALNKTITGGKFRDMLDAWTEFHLREKGDMPDAAPIAPKAEEQEPEATISGTQATPGNGAAAKAGTDAGTEAAPETAAQTADAPDGPETDTPETQAAADDAAPARDAFIFDHLSPEMMALLRKAGMKERKRLTLDSMPALLAIYGGYEYIPSLMEELAREAEEKNLSLQEYVNEQKADPEKKKQLEARFIQKSSLFAKDDSGLGFTEYQFRQTGLPGARALDLTFFDARGFEYAERGDRIGIRSPMGKKFDAISALNGMGLFMEGRSAPPNGEKQVVDVVVGAKGLHLPGTSSRTRSLLILAALKKGEDAGIIPNVFVQGIEGRKFLETLSLQDLNKGAVAEFVGMGINVDQLIKNYNERFQLRAPELTISGTEATAGNVPPATPAADATQTREKPLQDALAAALKKDATLGDADRAAIIDDIKSGKRTLKDVMTAHNISGDDLAAAAAANPSAKKAAAADAILKGASEIQVPAADAPAPDGAPKAPATELKADATAGKGPTPVVRPAPGTRPAAPM